jgi:hypothetical protein
MGMSPQTVNAYYNPSYNRCISAAILQPPFYMPNRRSGKCGGIGGLSMKFLMDLMIQDLIHARELSRLVDSR